MNPDEAVFNNIVGTKRAEVSTRIAWSASCASRRDKAVNPTSVMRCCAVAELEQPYTNTCVRRPIRKCPRSRGSVIPHFQKQIEPAVRITVTTATSSAHDDPGGRRSGHSGGRGGSGGEIFIRHGRAGEDLGPSPRT
jgi:hypothetical protein